MPVLQIIVASTRPTRKGGAIGDWFAGVARADGRFDVEVTDLLELGLPMMAEPHHPASGLPYTMASTQAWSERIAGSDAVVFVMPEYNHSFTAPLKNAIDHLWQEWAHKPAGFVSYGGISGGLRAVQALKPVLDALNMAVSTPAVNIPFIAEFFDEHGSFAPVAAHGEAAGRLLDELARLEPVVRQLRAEAAA